MGYSPQVAKSRTRLSDFAFTFTVLSIKGFPGSSVIKNLPANVRDAGSIPKSGRAHGEGNGKALQYSCLKNSIN